MFPFRGVLRDAPVAFLMIEYSDIYSDISAFASYNVTINQGGTCRESRDRI